MSTKLVTYLNFLLCFPVKKKQKQDTNFQQIDGLVMKSVSYFFSDFNRFSNKEFSWMFFLFIL